MQIEKGLSKELRSRTGGSFKRALADFTHTRDIEADIEWFEREAQKFRKEFASQARENARKVLDASLEAIGGVLTSYGVPAGSAVRAAKEIYRGADVGEKAADLIRLAAMAKNVDAPGYVRHRRDLAMTVKDLRNHQANVAYRLKQSNLADMDREHGIGVKGPKWEAAERANAKLVQARNELKTAWIEAEPSTPILAAFRRGEDVEKVDLGTLDKDPVEDEMRAVLLKVLPKMVDIVKVAWLIHLGPGQNGISPLALPPVVAMTRANMFIPDGSIRAGIVKDMVDEATDDDKWWVKVAAVALAIVTLIPSGGASAGLIGVAGASFAAYSAAQAWRHYDTQKSLANTDLDLARSLSTIEPTLTGFAVSLIAIGIEGIPLIGAFNKARKIKALLNEGGDVGPLVRELNADGKRYGVDDLGEQARRDAEIANQRTAKEAAERQAAEREAAEREAKKPTATQAAKPPPLPPEVFGFRSRAEAQRTVEKELAATRRDLPERWDLVKEALTANPGPNNRKILALLDDRMNALRDPKGWSEVLADIWEHAAEMPTPDYRTAVLEVMKKRGLPAPLEIGKVATGRAFFKNYVATGRPLIDKAFKGELHSELMHALQDLVIDRKFGPGASAQFRQLLANAEGSVTKWVPGAKSNTVKLSKFGEHRGAKANVTFLEAEAEKEILTGDYVWRFTYDLLYNDPGLRRLPQPEKMGPVLRWFFNLK